MQCSRMRIRHDWQAVQCAAIGRPFIKQISHLLAMAVIREFDGRRPLGLKTSRDEVPDPSLASNTCYTIVKNGVRLPSQIIDHEWTSRMSAALLLGLNFPQASLYRSFRCLSFPCVTAPPATGNQLRFPAFSLALLVVRVAVLWLL